MWDKSVPVETLMSKLYEISNASQKMLNAQKEFNPICTQGHECVGWGIDGVSGQPTPFPVVHLSYDPSRSDKKFNGLTEPVEVVSNHVVNPVWASVDGANAFPRIEDFEEHVNTVYNGATPMPRGSSGIYSTDFKSVFDKFFQKDDDRALSVVRASKSLISMSLPVDPVTKTRKYYFDHHASDFINSLPPTYETDDEKQQFRHFIENYGTSFAVSATLGGRVEQYSSWKSWITDERLGAFTPTTLAENAQAYFHKTTGLPGSSAEHDPGYGPDTVTLEPLNCQGGDATSSCDLDFKKWEASIGGSPILLDYELAPISDLIESPDIKKSLEAAVSEYVADRKKTWAETDKCPLNCGRPGAGSCVKGLQTSCSCKYRGFVGRMCSKCAPMQVRGTFTDIFGETHSNMATIGCSGTETAVWQGPTKCQDFSLLGERTCDTTASVQCARDSNGNLIARVHQNSCSLPPPGQAVPERRLLRSRKRRLHGQDLCLTGFDGTEKKSGDVSTSAATASVQQDPNHSGDSACMVSHKKKGKLELCQVEAKCEFV